MRSNARRRVRCLRSQLPRPLRKVLSMPWFFVGSSPDPPLCHPVPDNWGAKSVAVRAAMADGNLRIKRGKGFEGGGEGLRWAGPQGRRPNKSPTGLSRGNTAARIWPEPSHRRAGTGNAIPGSGMRGIPRQGDRASSNKSELISRFGPPKTFSGRQSRLGL
jgi:hypothetical protein